MNNCVSHNYIVRLMPHHSSSGTSSTMVSTSVVKRRPLHQARRKVPRREKGQVQQLRRCQRATMCRGSWRRGSRAAPSMPTLRSSSAEAVSQLAFPPVLASVAVLTGILLFFIRFLAPFFFGFTSDLVCFWSCVGFWCEI